MFTDWLTPLRWIYRGLLLALVTFLILPFTVLAQFGLGQRWMIGKRSLAERMLGGWSWLMCRVFGVRPRVFGQPLPGPVLVVSNHISWADIQLLHSQAAMSFIAKAEIGDWPLFGFLASSGGTVYHRRGDHDSAHGVAAQMHEKLAAGGRVAVFPEGGILPDDHVNRFHARMFRLAIEADCPIHPVMIRYTRNGRHDHDMSFINGENFMVNLARILGRPASVGEVHFLEPFAVEGRQRNELARVAQDQVEAAYTSPVSEA